MSKSTKVGAPADGDVAAPPAVGGRYATDDEFQAAYQAEKPRWAELAERLK